MSRSVESALETAPHRIRCSARRPALATAASLALAVMLIIAGCSRPISPATAQPVPDLTRQSEVIQRELDARNEQELRVRVVNVTRRILQGAETVDAEAAAVIDAEVDAINVLLGSLSLPPLAPALRFDAARGRLVW